MVAEMKNRIMFQLVNYEWFKQILVNIPHVRFLDMAMVFYYWKNEKVHEKGLVLVSNDTMNAFETSQKELMQAAIRNTPKKQPVSFQEIGDVIMEMFGTEIVLDGLVEPEIPMHVLTNKEKLFGAAAILYPQALRSVGAALGEDFYVLPSSIHEVIIVPKSVKCFKSELEQIVCDINHAQVPEKEVLSNHVYEYSREKNELTM